MGYFITFEGIEGCGKSTQIRRVGEELARLGIEFVLTEEPGGSDLGKNLRKVLLNRSAVRISAEAELLLFMADRSQHVREIIVPALDGHRIVLCDRFSDATIAYQGFGRGLDLHAIGELNRFACGLLKPDLTLLLDLPVEAGLARAMDRIAQRKTGAAAEAASASEDRFECEANDFHLRVREGYLTLARQEPDRFRVVDGSRDIETVFRTIWRVIRHELGQRSILSRGA